jgi:exodeoxyribonuclease VII small subunit
MKDRRKFMSPAKPKTGPDVPPVGELSYEEALAELESIVASLEASQLPLEESLALFERGQALTRRCAQLLDEAELRIKQLSGDTLVDMPPEDQAQE